MANAPAGIVSVRHISVGGGAQAEVIAEHSLSIDTGGLSQKVALSTTSAQSTVIAADYVVLSLDVAAFVRQGSNPTALSNGTDLYLPAGIYRVGITNGNKLALIVASGTGNAYITPGV